MRIAIVLITFLGGFGFVLWKLMRGVNNSSGWPAIATLAFAASAFLVFWLRRLRSGVAASQAMRQDANIAREVGDFSSSERLLLEAKQQAAVVNSAADSAVVSWDLANLYNELERWEEATTEVQSAIGAAEGERSTYARQVSESAPGLLIELLKKQEKWVELEALLREQLLGVQGQERAYVLEDLVEALSRQHKEAEAMTLIGEAVALRRPAREDEPGQLAKSLWSLGNLQLETKQFEAALQSFQELLAHAETMRGTEEEKGYWLLSGAYGLGQSNLASGKLESAIDLFERCLHEKQTSDGEADCLYQMAHALFKMRRYEEARARATQAFSIWDDEENPKEALAKDLIGQIRAEATLRG